MRSIYVRSSEPVARRVYELCREKGITINQLATLSGLPHSTIDSIIKGKSRNPRLTTIKKICDGLGMTISEFLDDPVFKKVED
ncbi:helix-turn-helix domain-containing protein [Desulfofundulus thermocisternus]|uniref:helix-turn-helix domain-containing protein n=2 Tax=Desulfofundulus thermocisternus TaxID=42471 RepID=UPI00217DB92C|nr:helix-turn-helix transcriptional regulator [Desulfofundulus thermocisternus]MCS5697376.1 helix-turn-helix domain-containing protein [Desulfofundulus thermocisternus]